METAATYNTSIRAKTSLPLSSPLSLVVQIASPKPILVRGGGRAPDREILERTHELMKQGVKGIVYGRNVIQHPNPSGMTRALMAIVHENKTPDQVIGWLNV